MNYFQKVKISHSDLQEDLLFRSLFAPEKFVLRIFITLKTHWSQPDFNPPTLCLEAST